MPDLVIPVAQVKEVMQDLKNKATSLANEAFKHEQEAECLRNREIATRQAADDIEDMIRAAEKV